MITFRCLTVEEFSVMFSCCYLVFGIKGRVLSSLYIQLAVL